jgi:hypothetical protein
MRAQTRSIGALITELAWALAMVDLPDPDVTGSNLRVCQASAIFGRGSGTSTHRYGPNANE